MIQNLDRASLLIKFIEYIKETETFISEIESFDDKKHDDFICNVRAEITMHYFLVSELSRDVNSNSRKLIIDILEKSIQEKKSLDELEYT